MDQEQIKNDITISGVTIESWGVKIKDEKGLVYNIPQFKKGTEIETVAYQKWKVLPQMGMNLKKTLTFVVVPNSQGGTSRYVRNIDDISGQPNVLPYGEKVAREGISRDKIKSEEEKWNEISKGKVRHGVACEFIRLGAEYNLETVNKINKWTAFIMTGEMFSKVEEAKISKEEPEQLPVKQIEDEKFLEKLEDLGSNEEIKIEDIPF